jgi:hypothetical protein
LDDGGVGVAIVLVRSQRDVVHRFVLGDLDDIELEAVALGEGHLDQRRYLRERFVADVRLLDQLGWELVARQDIYAITLPSDEIRATFGRLYAKASVIIQSRSREEFGPAARRLAFEVADTCAVVLLELPGGVRIRR